MVPSLTPATLAISFGVFGCPMRYDAMYIQAAAIDNGERPARDPNLSVLMAISVEIEEIR